MSMLRYDPLRDFERLSEQLLSGSARGVPRSFPMDAYRRGESFTSSSTSLASIRTRSS